MCVILIVCKIAIIINYYLTIKLIYQFKKMEYKAKLEFDLLSSIEISTCIGLNLVSLVAVIDPSTYIFTLCLSILGIVIAATQRYRIILVGDKKILFKGAFYDIRDIKKLGTGMFTLKIITRQNASGFNIFIPLTSNNVLKNKLQAKIKNN